MPTNKPGVGYQAMYQPRRATKTAAPMATSSSAGGDEFRDVKKVATQGHSGVGIKDNANALVHAEERERATREMGLWEMGDFITKSAMLRTPEKFLDVACILRHEIALSFSYMFITTILRNYFYVKGTSPNEMVVNAVLQLILGLGYFVLHVKFNKAYNNWLNFTAISVLDLWWKEMRPSAKIMGQRVLLGLLLFVVSVGANGAGNAAGNWVSSSSGDKSAVEEKTTLSDVPQNALFTETIFKFIWYLLFIGHYEYQYSANVVSKRIRAVRASPQVMMLYAHQSPPDPYVTRLHAETGTATGKNGYHGAIPTYAYSPEGETLLAAILAAWTAISLLVLTPGRSYMNSNMQFAFMLVNVNADGDWFLAFTAEIIATILILVLSAFQSRMHFTRLMKQNLRLDFVHDNPSLITVSDDKGVQILNDWVDEVPTETRAEGQPETTTVEQLPVSARTRRNAQPHY